LFVIRDGDAREEGESASSEGNAIRNIRFPGVPGSAKRKRELAVFRALKKTF